MLHLESYVLCNQLLTHVDEAPLPLQHVNKQILSDDDLGTLTFQVFLLCVICSQDPHFIR
ncbi:MAG: hypothetical protein ATN33_00095 [Epulopiscium sp. Nele67-Bin001]|nr:MAG: hypothetical protein ATN33_00095 [Epulopiscium sp. Nele67-Bin001]